MLPSLSVLFFGVVLANDKIAIFLRGVAPEHVARYTSDKFTCADGSLTIPQYMVNDDYCDCNDGSDEPGTSACRKGVFYCANKGFRSMYIPSSRVNDGICDCCDGSDEWKNRVNCQNNCVELGRESMKDLVAEVEKYESGVVKLKSLIESSQSLKAEKDQALTEANEKLTALESALKELEDKKNAEEALEKAEQDKRAPPPAAAEDTPLPPTPETQANEAAKEEGAKEEEERFPYPKEYQYKADEKKEEKEEEEKFPYPKEYAYKGDDDKTADNEKNENEENSGNGEDTEPESTEAPTTTPATVEKYVSDAAEAARTAFREKESEVRSARETRDKLQKELSNDFGAQGEYMSLMGSCFDVQVRQYTYEMCPYGSSAQKEGSSSTSLGNWEGFEKRENGQLVMKFGGGQRCWQGPERSFLVEVVCGIENQLSNVDEPSKCVYTARLATPVACTEARAKELREHLNSLLAAQS